MKVVLVRPTINLENITFFAFRFPTSLAGLASFLRNKGITVDIWDFEDKPEEVSHFKEKLRTVNPKIVGITCLTPTIIRGAQLAQQTKEVSKNILTVVGGPHSTAIPRETLLEFPAFDEVCIGEGEETLLEICLKMDKGMSLSGTKGIAHRQNGNVIIEPPRPLIADLDSLPYPAREFFDLKRKRRSHFSRGFADDFLKITDVYSARGCPYNCTFCAGNLSHSQKGIKYRWRSPNNLLGEIEECVRKFGFNHINLMDDTFTIDKKRVFTICEGIRKIGLKSWDCQARVDTVDKDILVELVRSGCKKISFGVESGSEKILRLIKKKITVQEVRNAFRWAKEARLRIAEGTFMVGSHPEENLEDINATIKLIREIKPDFISVSILVPYPGTAIYKEMRQGGYISSQNWEDYIMLGKKPQWRTKYFSEQDLVNIQQKILRFYYLSPKGVIRRLLRLKSLGELKYLIRAGFDFINLAILQKNR